MSGRRMFWEADAVQREAAPLPAPVAAAPAAVEVPRGPLGTKAVNQYGICLGMKGAGKTTYARHVYVRRRDAGGRCFFIDPKHSEDTRTGEIATTVAGVWAIMKRASATGARGFSIVVQLGWGESYERLWPLVYGVGDCLVVLDEVHVVASATKIGANLENLVRMGRNKRIDMIVTTQTLPGLHNLFRSQADWVVAFRQKKPAYAEQVADELLGDVRLAPALRTLPDFHYLREDGTGTITRGVVQL